MLNNESKNALKLWIKKVNLVHNLVRLKLKIFVMNIITKGGKEYLWL
jgi:hypothetical protein